MTQTNNIKENKTRKILIASLAVALAVIVGFVSIVELFGKSVFAANPDNQYVAEVRTYQGETYQDAKDLCRADGFIPVEGDLNEGTDEDAVILGYKTTTDESAALTDIRMMQMTSGFSTVNYLDIAKKHYPGIDSLVNDQYTMIQEFKEMAKGKQYNAMTALKFLNVYEIPELNMKLGDYFMSDKLSKDKLKEMFLQTAAVVSTTVTNLLAMGIQINWAYDVYGERNVMELPDDDAEPEEIKAAYEKLDREYLEGADRLIPIVQDFSTKVQNGLASMAENGGKLEKPDVDELSCKEMNEHGTESLYLNALDILNQYPYTDDVKLGDWLVEMGNMTLSKISEKRELYPLVAAMSNAQIISVQLVGIPFASFYLDELSRADKDFTKTIKDAQNACREFNNSDTISIWTGVDKKIFEQECAVTGDAQRYTNLKETADNLVQRNRFISFLENVSTFLSYACSIAGGAAVLSLPNTLVGWFAADAAAWAAKHFVLSWIFTALGKFAAVVGTVSRIATLVILVIMVIVYLYDALKPESDELDYTDIPTVTMDLSPDTDDSDNRGLLRYDLISSPDGKADLNAYEGKQWNALYSSQNPEAGKPIVVPENKKPFIVQRNISDNPAGYKAVKNFDELFAANLNANVKEENAPAIYLFYSSPNEKAATTVTEGEGSDNEASDEKNEAKTEASSSKQYIASLYLSCENNETLAKNKLTQKGYKVIDVNLSQHYILDALRTRRYYSYLGYTVTKNEKAAVTDIRMAKIKSTSQLVTYGNVKYTAAGYDAHGNSICYSKDEKVGSPILAEDFKVGEKLSDLKEGCEAVCYFGGTAYNFDYCDKSKDWENEKYIFFSPSEKITSETEYISGLYFVSGANARETGWSLEDYAGKLGGKILSFDSFTKGREWIKTVVSGNTGRDLIVENLQTFLCYTTTRNPKRAIYDVQFYAGTPRMQNFATTLTAYTGNSDSNYTQTGYGITSVFMQNCQKMANQSKTISMESLSHYEVNNYDDFTVSSGEQSDCRNKEVDNIIPGVKWKTVLTQPRMLYTCGPKQGYEPLTTDDLILSDSEEAPEGFASVQDVKFPYETKPLNLAYYREDISKKCNTIYMYINRKAPVKGKYIASITAATYNPDSKWEEAEREAYDNFSNDSCYTALLSASAEIFNTNLGVLTADAWYNKYQESEKYDKIGTDFYKAEAGYLGLTYTNNPSQAVHGIIRLNAQDGKTPNETLTVNGAKYSLVANVSSKEPVPITSPNGRKYYLYTTTSSGGSTIGEPLSEITVSEEVFEPSTATVLTVDKGDVAAQKDFYGKVIAPAEYATPYGDTQDVLFIHQKINPNLTGIDSFFVGTGDTKAEALKDLLAQGATTCLPLNMNEGSGSEASSYIGYHYYDPEYVNTKKTKYYMELAVKDLYIYVGDKPEKRLTIDKRKYTLCSNRNLNYGTGGTPMYLYQTTALINDKDKKDASYITRIGAAQYDRVPADIAEYKWENLLTTENKRINVNDGLNGGVRGFGKDFYNQHFVDSRVYVFVHRNDNYVKPEAVITGGYSTDTTTFGDVVLKKK